MNKKRKQRIISLLLVALLIVTGIKQVVYAADAEPTHFIVADYTELKTALGSAKDGDIITIMGEVIIGNNLTIGSEEKKLIIKRLDAESYLYLKAGNSTFNYCTFDGNGIKTTNSMIKMEVGTQTFNNCTFQNCGSNESLVEDGAIGGAAKVLSGSGVFNDCSFIGNYGRIGGSIAVTGDGKAYVNRCTIKNGGAGSYGGAVANLSLLATCEIIGGVITGNQANDFGGGIGNSGTFTITGVKLYGNSAVNGGADIANRGSGNTTLTDTVEQLNELFSNDNIQVTGWVCDYDFEEGVYIPDVDPYQENSLLKLQYEIIPDDSEEETESTEPGIEEGTEPVDPSEPSTEETEQPTTPSDEDDTDSTEESTETPTEPGTNDSEQDTTHDDTEPSNSVGDTNTDNSTQTDNSNNSVNTDNTDNSNNSVNTDNSDNSIHTDNSDNSSVDNSVTNNDSSSSSTTSNNTVDNSSVDNSKVDNSNVSNNSDSSTTTTNTTTTTNNYYTTESNQVPGQATAQPIVIQVQNDSDADDERVSESGSSSPNIRIDAQGVDCVFEYVDGVYNISITAQKETGGSDAVVPAVAPVQAVENSTDQEVDWLGIIQIVLLVAILLCLIWQPQRIGNRNIQG